VFVQVIEGSSADEAALHALLERWDSEVTPGATGFLGSTAGVAADGTAVVFLRFVDEAAAVWNRGHPETSAWWQAMTELFREPPRVHESSDVSVLLAGGSDDADFVQVMRAATPDRARIDSLMTPERIAEVQRSRPDLIGSIRVWLDDGSFIEAAYFTSEADAREAERSDDYDNAEAEFADAYGPMTFVDLPTPKFLSP